jgi:hypothetical protein
VWVYKEQNPPAFVTIAGVTVGRYDMMQWVKRNFKPTDTLLVVGAGTGLILDDAVCNLKLFDTVSLQELVDHNLQHITKREWVDLDWIANNEPTAILINCDYPETYLDVILPQTNATVYVYSSNENLKINNRITLRHPSVKGLFKIEEN